MKIHTVGFYQGKRIESDVTLCRDLIIQLSNGSTAQISGILIFCLCICDLTVDLLKIAVSDNGLAPQDQFPGIRNI